MDFVVGFAGFGVELAAVPGSAAPLTKAGAIAAAASGAAVGVGRWLANVRYGDQGLWVWYVKCLWAW